VETNLRARVRAGDPDAFGELFDECSRALYNHAFRLIGNWATAEDVVALTFLEAWRLRDRVDPEGGSLRPWLYGIATNVVRNTSRAARRHEAAVARLPRDEMTPDFADDLIGRIDDVNQITVVRDALARLRRGEREVFALCVWAGMDYAAAAEALGVPVGTVRSRLSRARKKLRRLVEPDGGSAVEPGPAAGQAMGSRQQAARLTPKGEPDET
jgi:RNA polymerase sigma factor (sigma-70 family)